MVLPTIQDLKETENIVMSEDEVLLKKQEEFSNVHIKIEIGGKNKSI